MYDQLALFSIMVDIKKSSHYQTCDRISFGYPGITVETEGHDRDTIDLPGYQMEVLKDAIFYGKSNHC